MKGKSISQEAIEGFRRTTESNPCHAILQKALVNSGIEAVTMNQQSEINMQYTFSTEIKTGDITHQKSSGRCWMFAGMNVLRKQIMDKCNLKTFELSQNYLLFYDKLEKANYFYENILDTLDMDTDSRLIAWLLSAPLQDGGQWDMLVNIINKYGVVPKWLMPETFHSSNTGKMVQLLTRKLRKDAAYMRREYRNGKSTDVLRDEKTAMMQDIYTVLCRCLGTPPSMFDFEYTDKDDKFTRVEGLTPKSFYDRYVSTDLSEYVSLINAPTADKPYGRTYTVSRLGNVYGGNDVLYLNVPIEDLKAAAVSQLKDGELVWFGCDVGKMLNRNLGIMDTLMYDYEGALGTSVELTKAEQLDYGDSLMTHAMVFTAVNEVNGRTVRWKVENSWGDKSGKDGWFIMSDEWFDKFMYQVVVNKKHLTEEQRKSLAQEPIVLKPWDPMGSLAL
ncbi:MAG TPA: C1 family peptidase [Clostridia bacterium]|nr:C1 family peptidase [Clostridia bacterium]